jgi:multiple sugar transport system substrate-binding protein
MYQEGLAPKSLLTDDPGKLSNEMAQGNAAFYVLHHYFLTSIRSLEGPQSANVKSAAAGPSTLQIGEVLQMGVSDSEEERLATWELMKYYGWKGHRREVQGVQPVGQGRRPRRPPMPGSSPTPR